MRSPVFRKLLLIAVVIVLVTLAAVDHLISRAASAQRVSAEENRLVSTGKAIAAALALKSGSQAPRDALSRWCAATGDALQWIDPGGSVVAACNSGAGPGESVLGDQEVRDALKANIARATRGSGVSARSYVAIPVRTADGGLFVLRLISPVRTEEDAVFLRWQVALTALAAVLVALAIAYLVTRSWTRRVNRIKTYAETLLDAPPASGGIPDSNDELAALERSIHNVAAQLRDLFERWNLESSRSEAILSSMAEGVLAVDRELRVVFCNRAVIRAMGVRMPVRERTPVLELMRDSELIGILKRVVEGGETVKQSVKMAAASGRTFEVQAAPFAAAGGNGALAIFYDMTDIERLEQVRKDFVANVSHEMRTPLAAIVGYADTLLDGGLEDADNNRRFVDVIRGNAIRLNSIASDLLVLSELESGNKPGEPEVVSVRDVLESALTTVESEARNRGIQLLRGRFEDATVLGYRFRLEQAMLNLMVNAVKFNRKGGEVRVEATRTQSGDIRITISDTGVGIPSQDLPRIFERFYRVDRARSREVGGTGLGLSIVRHVIERMNGRIEVESQLGRGSTFTVILPTC